MVVIGGVIGGVTNLIAIRMLFRPFQAIYIGRYRMPFTPGLIPKRRGELAEQLGKLVVGHLITVEGVRSKLFDETLLNDIRDWFTKKVKDLTSNQTTLEQWWKAQSGGKWSSEKTKSQFISIVAERLVITSKEYRDKPLESWLPGDLMEKGNEKIPHVADAILKKGKVYVQSKEGKDKIEEMVSRYFLTKGSFGGMVGRMVSNIPIASRIQQQLLRFLEDEKSKKFIEKELHKEWKQLRKKSLNELFPYINWEEKAGDVAGEMAKKVPILSEWERPMHEWAPRYEDQLILMIPTVLDTLSVIIERNLQRMLQNLKLDDIVKQQVNSFPLPRIEKMILSIAKKELKMIALLGALIGGCVGFFQGLLVIFFF